MAHKAVTALSHALGGALPAARRRRADAARAVQGLPAYQVALWPDGWEPLSDGAVRVRDTDRMAEARRWYQLVPGSGRASGMERIMGLHGTFVPRPVVELAGRRFGSERSASVALKLVAGGWIESRRAQLLRDPARALAERELCWSGSRSGEIPGSDALIEVIHGLMALAAAEGLVPRVDYRLRVVCEDGYGVTGYRCTLDTGLDRYARARLREVLCAGLVPWNRALAREGRSHPVIGLEVRQGAWRV